MLTWGDRTVENCLEVFDSIKDTGLKHVGFKDIGWLTENLPGAEAEILPAGLGHLPQLVHRERFERLIRDFVTRLP